MKSKSLEYYDFYVSVCPTFTWPLCVYQSIVLIQCADFHSIYLSCHGETKLKVDFVKKLKVK